MLSVISLIAPVFGLIGLGFLAARLRWLDPSATRALSEFGYRVAVPALLFRVMSSTSMPQVSPLRLLGAYFAAITTIWILATLATWALLRRPAADAPAIAMGSCFGNGVMLGIPLILGALGNDAATPIAAPGHRRDCLPVDPGDAAYGDCGPWIEVNLVCGHRRHSARCGAQPDRRLGRARSRLGGKRPHRTRDTRQIAFSARSIGHSVALFALGMSLSAYSIKGEIATMTLICALKLAFYPALASDICAVGLRAAAALGVGAVPVHVDAGGGQCVRVRRALRSRRRIGIGGDCRQHRDGVVISVTIVLAILRAGWLGGSL